MKKLAQLDREIAAMQKLADAMSVLTYDQLVRVMTWLLMRFESRGAGHQYLDRHDKYQ